MDETDPRFIARNRAEVMIAFADGKTIQARLLHAGTGDWSISTSPCWDWIEYEYRVLPEPREWWMVVNSYGETVGTFQTCEDAEAFKGSVGMRKIVHVREVIEG